MQNRFKTAETIRYSLQQLLCMQRMLSVPGCSRCIAKNHKQYINRISAYQSLELFADYEEVPEILSQIKDNEKDERVLKYLNQ